MKQILSLTLIINLLAIVGYVFFEPQLIKAADELTNITLTVTGEITFDCSSTAALAPSLPGQTGGTATGTFGCVVSTNNSTGYNMTIKKDQKLEIADVADQRFDDYTTTSDAADWAWGSVGAGNEEFGFAINSCASTTDIVAAYRDNGSDTCATGDSVTAWKCWRRIPTSPLTAAIANRTTATPLAGVLTTFGLQAEAGSSNNLTQGSYACTTTVTAVTNP